MSKRPHAVIRHQSLFFTVGTDLFIYLQTVNISTLSHNPFFLHTGEPRPPVGFACRFDVFSKISGDPAGSSDLPPAPGGLPRHEGGFASGCHYWKSEGETSESAK